MRLHSSIPVVSPFCSSESAPVPRYEDVYGAGPSHGEDVGASLGRGPSDIPCASTSTKAWPSPPLPPSHGFVASTSLL